jgi:hypothetical protein
LSAAGAASRAGAARSERVATRPYSPASTVTEWPSSRPAPRRARPARRRRPRARPRRSSCPAPGAAPCPRC